MLQDTVRRFSILFVIILATALSQATLPSVLAESPAKSPANTALVPVTKLEKDSYDWFERHAAILKIKDRIDPQVVMIGDSITHFWSGEPKANLRNGPRAWQDCFGRRRVLNLGYGWDRTQNVLWRLEHGEFDGLHPAYVVINIGTNNFATTANFKANTPAQVAEAIEAICRIVQAKSPTTHIILMGVFPRGRKPDDPVRATIAELNRRLAKLGEEPGIKFLDIGPRFLQPDGEIPQTLMYDFCHPSEQGYSIWAKALKPLFKDVLNLRCEYRVDPDDIDVRKPRLSWQVDSDRRDWRQTAYRVIVASTPELLAKDEGDLWDSGRVASEQSTQVEYAGKPLQSRTSCYWKVRVWDNDSKVSDWSETARWSMGLLEPGDWQAKWIRSPDAAAAAESKSKSVPITSPWMRKTFELDAKPQRARAYVNSMGYHELYVNGKKIGADVLSPAVSDFSKRSFYVAHDITPYLRKGRNCLALWLGQGWHSSGVTGVAQPGPVVRAQFDICTDGKTARILTDETWKTRASSRSLLGKWYWNDFGGERYDARLDDEKWNLAECDAADWQSVEIATPPATRTESQPCPPNRIGRRLPAVKCDEWGKGRWYVLDFGTNLSGWLRMRMPAMPAGQTVRIHYADAIYASAEPEDTPAGKLAVTMSDKLFEYDGGKARAQTHNHVDEFISAGRAGEEFCSKFNYHGFRYAIIEGLPAKPSLDDAEALLIESDLAQAGSFACSDELLNRIYQFNMWTLRCLDLGGYLVDCPHRERVGYGDGQVSIESCLMNFWMPNFYQKWLDDWLDAQDPKTGDIPHTAPHMPGGGGPGWGGAAAAMAWRTYLYYGDRRVLEKSYDSLRRYVDFLESRCKDNILRTYGGKWDFIGDWVPPGHGMDSDDWELGRASEIFNNCYRVYLWDLLEKTASALGREDETRRCRAKLDEIRPLIHKEFFDPARMTYVLDGQTYRCFPLYAGVAPDTQRKAVCKALENNIVVQRKGHLDTGMLGTYFLIQYLQQADRNDLIYTIVAQKTYPGWGYMLDRGATTMWEQWNGYYSRIHSCFTSIGGWFNQGIAGIQPDPAAPGFKRVVIKPAIVGDLTWAKAHPRRSLRPHRKQLAARWR